MPAVAWVVFSAVRAMPKSPSLNWPLSDTKIFWGLISRCRMFFCWHSTSALQISLPKLMICASVFTLSEHFIRGVSSSILM